MSEEIKSFILDHQDLSPPEVALLLSKKPDFPKSYILNQINGKQKAKGKFPFLLNFPEYRYPSAKAVAQSSSVSTASYKASLVEGKTLIDACGGMGIDSYFFSKNFDRVIYLEPNEELFETSKENFHLLEANNIECLNHTIQDFLSAYSDEPSCFYFDPDRRKENSRAFLIEDCEPNMNDIMPLIWKKTNRCVIKYSPMLDIQYTLKQFPNCKEVHVVSVDNECKELIFLLEKEFDEEATVLTVNITGENKDCFKFKFSEEKECSIQYSDPLEYIYEPNASVLKAGAFNCIGLHYNLKKLAVNTHLYTSNNLIERFPGRIFRVKDCSSPAKGMIQNANISSRNFPLSVKEIRNKYKIREGGISYLFACRLANKKPIFMLTEKV